MPALDSDTDTSTAIGQLIRDANRRDTEPMSRERERELLERYAETGEVEARNQVVSSHVRYAISEASRWAGSGSRLDHRDAVAAALEGLLRGVESNSTDHPGEVRALSYARYSILQALQRAEARHQGSIRRTAPAERKRRELRRTRDRLRQELGRPPTDAELRQALNCTQRQLQGIQRTQASHVTTRLDAKAGEENGSTQRHALFPGSGADEVTEEVEREVEREHLSEILDDVLTEREALILRLRFGLDEQEPATLREAGEVLGITAERIRQLQERAVSKLRDCGDVDELREAFERGYLKAA